MTEQNEDTLELADQQPDPEAAEREFKIAVAQRAFLMAHVENLINRLAGEKMASGQHNLNTSIQFVQNELSAVNNVLAQIYEKGGQ